MTDQPSKAKPKRLSKGGRVHVRRMKQAARKADTALESRRYSVPKKTI